MLEHYSRKRVGYYNNGLLKYCNDRHYTRMSNKTAVAVVGSGVKLIGVIIVALINVFIGNGGRRIR